MGGLGRIYIMDNFEFNVLIDCTIKVYYDHGVMINIMLAPKFGDTYHIYVNLKVIQPLNYEILDVKWVDYNISPEAPFSRKFLECDNHIKSRIDSLGNEIESIVSRWINSQVLYVKMTRYIIMTDIIDTDTVSTDDLREPFARFHYSFIDSAD